jgi:hypothetical protein
MTEQKNIDISIPRLLMAAIKTSNELKVDFHHYTSEELDSQKIMLSYDDESKQFILTLEKEIKDDIPR